MSGAVGSLFGGGSFPSLAWMALWLLFGPIMFMVMLLRPQRFRERRRNMWLSGAVTVAPLFFILLGRLLDSV